VERFGAITCLLRSLLSAIPLGQTAQTLSLRLHNRITGAAIGNNYREIGGSRFALQILRFCNESQLRMNLSQNGLHSFGTIIPERDRSNATRLTRHARQVASR
jgi:hypothetical protein